MAIILRLYDLSVHLEHNFNVFVFQPSGLTAPCVNMPSLFWNWLAWGQTANLAMIIGAFYAQLAPYVCLSELLQLYPLVPDPI